MRRLGLVLGVLASVLLVSTAFAWEFSMTGKYSWETEYLAQMGKNGFWGKADDYAVPTVAAQNDLNVQFWAGRRGEVSGLDAIRGNQDMKIYPEIRINKALRVRGLYRVGGNFNGAPDGRLENSRFPGTWAPITFGEWDQLWGTAQLPFGIAAFGKRPFTFGCGLFFNGEQVTTSESLLFVAPYGPLTFLAGGYFKGPAARYATPYYNRPWDASAILEEVAGALTYRACALDAGVIAVYRYNLHTGPEAALVPATTRLATPTVDQTIWYGSGYTKYNNGRFFFNGEVAWLYLPTKFSGPTLGGRAGAAPANNRPLYIDHVGYMVETGGMVGPTKLSLLYYHRPGADRRFGMPNDSQGRAELGLASLAGTGVTLPYSRILGYTYGSGVGAFDANLKGYFNDATVVAARLDYAVAANLNIWGSALYAERATVSGWSFGCLSPHATAVPLAAYSGVTPPTALWAVTPGGATTSGGRLVPTNNTSALCPNIPDPSLGYEFRLGMNWKLLEGYTWNLDANYWMPGGWFNYATRDRSSIFYNTLNPAAGDFGTRPSKTLDSVVQVYSNFVLSF
ncbi:MAG: hypothetical protein AB1646_10745 [Thermodesulfobacteriota bacterium]